MIYLDHAAATPVDKRVLEAMLPYFGEDFFNPSSAYLPAKKVKSEYLEAKDKIAHAIGAKGVDLVITAGATESINLAFLQAGDGKCLILKTEHDSVKNVSMNYKAEEIAVDKNGMIVLEDLIEKIDDEVSLVSIALADGELGTIQPMSKIAEIIKNIRQDRMIRGVDRPILLHSDASQALSLIDISVARMGIDLLTINSGKIYGPKGVGALYIARGVKVKPAILGGGQERGLRSGTENVPGVIGFAKAVEITKENLVASRKQFMKYKEIFLKNFNPTLTDFKLLGSTKNQLANFLPISINGIDAERLIFLLEDRDIYLSTGAACAASKGLKSRTLGAIGLSDKEIAGSLRISFGKTNDKTQIAQAGKIMAELVDKEVARVKDLKYE